jgi:LysR family transcriptional regulator, mexEF-oprN operon transcriptional activator
MFVLKQARMVATVPQPPARIFADRFGLATSPVPVDLADFSVWMLWHASYDHDPGISGCARRSPGSLLDP